jgi:tRNA(fMet)-specific endonuclease VapC
VEHYADIRHALEKAGTPINPNDLIIAATARAAGVTLVTANVSEFSRVPGLKWEDWTK